MPAETGNTVYVRMVSDGGTLTAQYSLDGETFTQLGNAAPLKTGATIGPVAAGDTDAPNKTAAFDWFRVTPDGRRQARADDEFAGSALDGCRWDRIHGWNASQLRWSTASSRSQHVRRRHRRRQQRDIQNLILQTPPAGDWTIETKVTAPLNDTWQLAGFMLYSDDDHYVKYDVVADNESGEPGPAPHRAPVRERRRAHRPRGRRRRCAARQPDRHVVPAPDQDGGHLHRRDPGRGRHWVKTPGSVTVALDDPAVGLMAIGPDQDVGPIDVTSTTSRSSTTARP